MYAVKRTGDPSFSFPLFNCVRSPLRFFLLPVSFLFAPAPAAEVPPKEKKKMNGDEIIKLSGELLGDDRRDGSRADASDDGNDVRGSEE